MNYYLKLAYNGTNYRGFQWQPGGVVTVQGDIERVLAEIHHREVRLNGCGRTDAGVHASQFYGHVELLEPPRENYLFILNKRLPPGIVVHEIIPVGERAHSRYNATERTYDYFLHTRPDAFLQPVSTLLEQEMGEAAGAVSSCLSQLIGNQDFRPFCLTPDKHPSTVCDLRQASWYRSEDGRHLRFRFVADRFLRGMIRILVHELLAVARGEVSKQTFKAILASAEARPQLRLAPPEGLFLTGVRYDYLDREPELPAVHQRKWVEITGQ